MDNIESRILQLKDAIEEDKKKRAKIEGAIEELAKQLKNKYNATSDEEVEKILLDSKTEIEKLQGQIKDDFKKLVKLYEW